MRTVTLSILTLAVLVLAVGLISASTGIDPALACNPNVKPC